MGFTLRLYIEARKMNVNCNGKLENDTKFGLQWKKINKRICDALFVARAALSIGCETVYRKFWAKSREFTVHASIVI